MHLLPLRSTTDPLMACHNRRHNQPMFVIPDHTTPHYKRGARLHAETNVFFMYKTHHIPLTLDLKMTLDLSEGSRPSSTLIS
jgi:hypothetical protein